MRLEEFERGTVHVISNLLGGAAVALAVFVMTCLIMHVIHGAFRFSARFKVTSTTVVLLITILICTIYTNDSMTTHVVGVWLATNIITALVVHSVMRPVR